MSGFSVTRAALAGVLLAAAPAAAQDAPPAAPPGRIEIELRLGAPNGVALNWTVNPGALRAAAPGAPSAPMPRPCAPAPTFQHLQTLRGDVFQLAVPPQPQPFVIAPPMPVAPVMPSFPAPVPAARAIPNSNDPMRHMARELFGQLLVEGGVTAPQCVGAVPCSNSAPLTVTVVAAKPGVVGTWHREMGSSRCTIKIDHDHMTITVSQTGDKDGKRIGTHLTLIADYHIARDGHTAVGLITSVDAKLDGASDDESAEVMNSVAELQKALEEKPFAMTCRRYGDALVIGNLRLPGTDPYPANLIGGRYTSGEPNAATKTTKASAPRGSSLGQTWYGGTTLPSGRYFDHLPQYITPDSVFPLPRELASMEDSAVRPAGGLSVTMPRATVCPSAALGCAMPRSAGAFELSVPPAPAPAPLPLLPPVPQMPAPVPPVLPVPPMPQPIPPQFGFVPAIDPNVKMQQLLYQQEDLRQFKNQWRRFWFNDQPSHLTPERVHGGIY